MANPILNQIAKLVSEGFPESTARKIVTGELDMSLSARNARMREQGYDPTVTYHHGSTGIKEFKKPREDRFLKFGSGIYSSPDPEYGAKYAAQHGMSETQIYPLVGKGKIADWEDLMKAQKRLRYDPNYQWMGHDPEWSAIQEDLKSKGFTGIDALKERVMFNPSDIRDVERAAFDPDQVGNPNILASAAPVAAGGLLAALGMPDRATAAETAIGPDYLSVDKKQAGGEIQQMILDALLGFLAPSQIGDATMDAYNRSRGK